MLSHATLSNWKLTRKAIYRSAMQVITHFLTCFFENANQMHYAKRSNEIQIARIKMLESSRFQVELFMLILLRL